MGANSPSTTPYAYKVVASIKSIFKMLFPQYRGVFKKYAEYILNHRVGLHYATEHLPILVAIVIIQVERDLHYAAEINELYRQIEELRRERREPKRRSRQ
jgi:hypothetical protein